MGQDQSLKHLHHMRCECYRAIVIEPRRSSLFRDRNNAGRLPQHRDGLQVQAEVEEILENRSQLAGTGPQDPGADTIRASSLALVEFFHLTLDLSCAHSEAGGGGLMAGGIEGGGVCGKMSRGGMLTPG